MKNCIKFLSFVLIVNFIGLSSASAAEEIRFGVPPWPGVTVKTEIVCQILETIGYETEREEVGPPVIYKSMDDDELDVFLGAWTPQQNPLLNPLKEKGKVEIVQTNLEDAVISLCVPKSASEAGVKSFSDLDKHAEKFNNQIYNIEVGSPMHTAMGEIIEKDTAGLGDWEQTGTTTPMMLKEVKSKIDNGEWVAFACWKPHWMNVMIDMAYLEPVEGTGKFASDSLVHTVARSDVKNVYPEVYKMLKNIRISSMTQSEWIDSYARDGQDVEIVSENWIKNNHETVSQWLKGVKAKDGSPADAKVFSKY